MTRPLALAVALIALASACDQPVAGKDDVLSFRYDVDDQLFPPALTTPAAATMLVDVEVFGKGGKTDPANVIDATSSAPAVADVVATTGNRVTIRAKTHGRAEIAVRTTQGDDAFDLDVAAIVQVDLKPPGVLVPDNPPSKAVSGGTARFFATFRDGSDRALVGYGPVTITAEPAGAATFPEVTDIGMVPIQLNGEGVVSLQATNDAPLSIEVVPTSALAALTFKGFENVTTLPVAGTTLGVLRGLTADGDTVVGVASLASIASADPTRCEVTPNHKLGEGVFTITGKATGACRIDASLGALQVAYDLEVVAK